MTFSTFQELSKNTARRFIQTVVIVDDQASFSDEKPAQPKPGLTKPNKRSTQAPLEETLDTENNIDQSGETVSNKAIKGIGSNEQTESASSPQGDVKEDPHVLKAMDVINSFADQEIVCSVVKPTKDDSETVERILKVARKSDILILDWILFQDAKMTINIIDKVISSDQKQEDRLRLIVILTGEKDLFSVTSKINCKINEDVILTDKSYLLSSDRPLITKGELLRIVALAKPGAVVPKDQEVFKLSSFKEITNRVIDEFSELTSGLISNVAVESVTQIRQNTHKLLAKFHKNLDIPFLTHRVSLEDSIDDAQYHLLEIINSELRVILNEVEIDKLAGESSIELWLKQKYNPANIDSSLWMNVCGLESFELNSLLILLTQGIKNGMTKVNPNISKSKKKEAYKNFSAMLSGSTDKGANLDSEFSCLTSFASTFLLSNGKTIKPLNLSHGTIVKAINPTTNYEYFVCIQPRCDSVRLRDCTQFSFLPMELIDSTDKSIDLVLPSKNDLYLKFKIVFNIQDLFIQKFLPSESSKLVLPDTSYLFTSCDNYTYQWMASLKYEQALRISNQFASKIARVGLNESEWLRLQKPKSDYH